MDAMLAGSQVPKDISLFVSSTFRDMQDERDVLRDLVLPRLREFVRPYGIAADLVDLRWGVDTSAVSEEEQDAKVLEVCLGEIDRCEPFFVLLLGDRYGYVPEGSSTSVTEQEIDHALADSRCAQRLVCCLRTIDNPSSLSPAQRKVFLDPTHAGQLSALRARLKADYPDAILEYSVHVERDGSYDLDAFCEQVVTALERRVREELGEPPVERLHPLEAERARQVAQAYRLSASFVGREEVVSSLASYCARDDAGLLLVQAEAGAGKTALVARLATQLAGMGTVVVAFCGLGPEVSDLPGLLRYLVWSLSSPDAVPEGLYDLTYAQLVSVLHAALEERLKEGPVTLLVDAVDQLADAAEGTFNWAGHNLPRGCHIVCTSLPGDYATALSHVRGSSWPLPSFGEKDARQLVDAVCTRNHKGALPDAVVDDLLAKAGETGGINPLYVSLVVRHLLMLGKKDYRAIDRTQREYGLSPIQAQIVVMRSIVMTLPADCEGMYEVLVCDAMEVTGLKVFPFFLLAIAASRWGLRVEDLSGSLGARFDPAVFAWFRQVLSEDFIQRGRMEWDFAHQSFRRMIWHRHRDELLRANRELVAPYLLSRARFTGDPLPGYRYLVYSADVRDAFVDGEVMHHLCLADDAAGAAGLLCQEGVLAGLSEQLVPLGFSLVGGLAGACVQEASLPFERTFLCRAVRAMQGRGDGEWYWFVLAFDRVGLFSHPETYALSDEWRLSLFSEIARVLGEQGTGSDLDKVVRATVLIELGRLGDGVAGMTGKEEERSQASTYLARAEELLAGLDLTSMGGRMGYAVDLNRRLGLDLGHLHLSQSRYDDARACYERYIESSERVYRAARNKGLKASGSWGDLLAGYISLLQLLLMVGDKEAASPVCGRMVALLDDQKMEDLDANQLSHAMSAWGMAGASLKISESDAEAVRCAYESLSCLVRITSLWPDFLSSMERDRELISDLRVLQARPLPEGEGRRTIERLAQKAIDDSCGLAINGVSMAQVMAEAGLSETVVARAYSQERVAALKVDNDERRRAELDRTDWSYAAYEESIGNYQVSDEILSRLERSLENRLASPAGAIVGNSAAWKSQLSLIRDLRSLRASVLSLSGSASPTEEELSRGAQDCALLASRYLELRKHCCGLVRRELELFRRSLDCCRALKERGSSLYDPWLHASACLCTGERIEVTATSNKECAEALSILFDEGVGAASLLGDNDGAHRLLQGLWMCSARCCSHSKERKLLEWGVMLCRLSAVAYQRIAAKTMTDDERNAEAQHLAQSLQKVGRELYPDFKVSVDSVMR